jgi:hypothetical protein
VKRIHKADTSGPRDLKFNEEHNPNAKFAYGILKRLYRRMQMRGVRIMQIARKKRSHPTLLYRAYTWEEACRMLEIEMEALKCQIKRTNQTLT